MPEIPEDLAPSTRAIYAVFDFLGARKRIILPSLSAVAVLAFLASGFYVVKKEEEAVLTRFGKVVDPKIPPGLHYALPFVERAQVRKVMRITRSNVATQGEKGAVSFSMLSGDANLFEADVALQFKIGDLRNYLYATVDPETVLTLIVRERLIDIMGRNYIDLIFTNNRDIIQAHLFKSTTAYLKANDIGIELLALNIVDLRPIEETVAAFRDVSDAIAESIQSVSDARRRTEQLLARSRGQAEAVVTNARARAKERVMQAGSSARDVFGSAGRLSQAVLFGDGDALLAADAQYFPRRDAFGGQSRRCFGDRHQYGRRIRAGCRPDTGCGCIGRRFRAACDRKGPAGGRAAVP